MLRPAAVLLLACAFSLAQNPKRAGIVRGIVLSQALLQVITQTVGQTKRFALADLG